MKSDGIFAVQTLTALCSVVTKTKNRADLWSTRQNSNHGSGNPKGKPTTPIKQSSDYVHHKSPLLYENKSNSNNKTNSQCGGQASSLSSLLSEYGENIPQRNSFVNRVCAVNLHKKFRHSIIIRKKAAEFHARKIYRNVLAILGAKARRSFVQFYPDFTLRGFFFLHKAGKLRAWSGRRSRPWVRETRKRKTVN